MAKAFQLPDVGEGMHEAEIIRWLVEEGSVVRELEPIVEIQTDKAIVELPAPSAGTIAKIYKSAGDIAKVGEVLVDISAASESSEVAADNAAASNLPVRPLATPGVRHYARAANVDLRKIRGTGSGGRITKSDVDASKQAMPPRDVVKPLVAPSAASPVTPSGASEPRIASVLPFRGIRKATASRVTASAFRAPHVTAFDDCDATALVALRSRWNATLIDTGRKLSYLPFLMKATAQTLKAHPTFNARLDEAASSIYLYEDIHLGIAMDTADGLIVPVIRDVAGKSMLDLADILADYADRSASHRLHASELKGSTFTISNVGSLGGLFATPILNGEEVAILAVHKIQKKPVVVDDEIVIRQMLTLSLSFDHRIIDGAAAIRFMNQLRATIENPENLLLALH